MTRLIPCFSLFVLLFAAPPAFGQSTFYVDATATTQGVLPGDATAAGHEGQIRGLQFHHRIQKAIDPNTGRPTGAHAFSPITFVKPIDASTPLLQQAAVSSEILPSVVFTFYRSDGVGGQELYYRIALTNAYVADIRQWAPASGSDTGGRESVSLSFEDIGWEVPGPNNTSTSGSAPWATSP